MRVHEVRSIEIEAHYERAFAFIADPANLPVWAQAFDRVDDGRAWIRTPRGMAEILLNVSSSAEYGTIDWEMTFPAGSVATAMSRITRAPHSRLVYAFVLNAPPGPMEAIEGALSEQVTTLESELERLKELLSQ